MNSTNKFSGHGVGVALVTPFKSDGEIDFPALTNLLNYVSAGGVDYLVVMGTTAESATLSETEKVSILKHVLANNPKGLPIVYGIGGNNTRHVVDTIKTSDLTGVSAILSVVPYYNKPNQEGIFQHYSTILENSPLPVILYNVPGRTGTNMEAKTTLRLSRKYPDKALGIKEASGNLNQVAYILRDRPENFAVISGDDNLTLPIIALGGEGVISVSANPFPHKFSQMVHAAIEGDLKKAASLNLQLYAVTDMLFKEGNPVGPKAALNLQGIIENNLRLPLVSASSELIESIRKEIEYFNLQ